MNQKNELITQNTQLSLFENQLAEVPKTRALVLRKVAMEKGIEFASVRSLSFVENRRMTDAAKGLHERLGSTKPLFTRMMGLNTQMNAACLIKSVNDPAIGIKQIAARVLLQCEFTEIMETAVDSEEDKTKRKEAARTMRERMEKRAA